jgi:hypothetical protein
VQVQNTVLDLTYQREHRLSESDQVRLDVRNALRETKAEKEGSTAHGGRCARRQQLDSNFF